MNTVFVGVDFGSGDRTSAVVVEVLPDGTRRVLSEHFDPTSVLEAIRKYNVVIDEADIQRWMALAGRLTSPPESDQVGEG